jgi:hypothetical protein
MIISMLDFMYGNLCRDKMTGELLEVIQIGKPECKDYIGFCVLNRSKFPLPDGWQAEPIELNIDVLKQFKVLSAYNWLMNIIRSDQDYYCGIIKDFQFLHQFQNIFQLLTGEPLKLIV